MTLQRSVLDTTATSIVFFWVIIEVDLTGENISSQQSTSINIMGWSKEDADLTELNLQKLSRELQKET